MNARVENFASEADATDPILHLRMPGCFVSGANPAARDYFKHHAGIDLATSSDAYLGTLFQGPGIVLADHCPFEQAYELMLRQAELEPTLAAFHFGNANGKRYYKLFVLHALASELPEELVVRFLPLPAAAFELVLEDLPGDNGVHAYTPHSTVVGGDFFYCEDASARARLAHAQDICAKLANAERPAIAFEKLGKDDVRLMPPYILRLFKSPTQAALIRQTLTRALAHPLDAPLLAAQILPAVLNHIKTDRDLRYLPTNEEEQLQYLRARLPLRELQKQDFYLRWLPLQDDWDHSQSRDDLYQA